MKTIASKILLFWGYVVLYILIRGAQPIFWHVEESQAGYFYFLEAPAEWC